MELLRRFSFTLLLMSLMTLVACGSGDGDLTGGGGESDAITLSLVLSDDNVTEQSPITITATVLNGASPLQNMRVSFSIDDPEYGFFTPEKGTATTDANGQANITLNSGTAAGAGKVTATLDSGESSELFFNSQGASDVVLRIGSGDPFIEGLATLGVSEISAGATTSIYVKLVDEQGDFYKEPVDVNFTSICAEQAVPSAEIDKVVSTSNGEAEASYLAKGCVDDDPITVNAIINGVNLQATATLNILPADVGSIEFISASPENISILGTGSLGGSESSVVKFRVLDSNGNPVINRVVNFSLNTDVGNIQLIPDSAQTNSLGIAQTVINSGTVATSVRVQATIDDGGVYQISSQSSLLVISTGIPDQDSFSLSANILNPEGWDLDGTTVDVTARLADAFNNPVPDGTAVNFTTEGGSIEPFCTTTNGVCTVQWFSQYPKPTGKELIPQGRVPEEINTMGQLYGGRATILATAIGEESFPDLNGNGRFDASEMTAFAGNDVSGRPYDLKEAFADYNEDGFYNPGESNGSEEIGGELEEFLDFNNDGTFTVNDGKYNGVLCSIPAHNGCSENKSHNVRAQLVLVMSGSNPLMVVNATDDAVSETIDDPNDTNTPPAKIPNPNFNPNDTALYIAGENTGFVTLTISDLHNQPMPAGTTITFDASVGGGTTPSTYVWPNDNHNGGRTFSIAIKGAAEPASGVLSVTIETEEGGVATTFSPVSIIIQ